MIGTIFSVIGGLKGAILGGIGLLASLFALFWRGRFKREQAKNVEYQQVVKVHEAKERIHEQDQTLETEVDKQIEDIHEKVNQAETPEEAAKVVADGLNDFFGGDKLD